ncbi:MAG: N-acetylmuramoyl-L-alanine amidase [Lachnospiraceae bacterium]|nr:N-acetylmuramoyl-L-alanine amidase [Lachnospiraceae bacterium]
MYGRTRRYYRKQRRREEIRGYLRTFVWVLTVICILVVVVAMAVQTNSSKVVAAEIHEVPISTDEAKMLDVASVMTKGSGRAALTAVENAKAEVNRVIVIDPGHGGMDGGCGFAGVLEKDINREIADKVADKLQARGYRVVLARKADDLVDKADRIEEANRLNARLYVSIHQNSYEDNSVSGIETWYDESDATGAAKRLAALIQQEAVKASGAVDRGLASDPEMCVTSKSKMPSCLIETGFLSNEAERKKLETNEYQDQLAEGIANAIDLYLHPTAVYLV